MVQLNISDAERKKLTDANKDALEKAMQRLTAATMKQAGVDPKSISPFDKDKAK